MDPYLVVTLMMTDECTSHWLTLMTSDLHLYTLSGSVYDTLLLSISACSRMCQNGGTLDEGNCMCNCADGYSGPTCESECTSSVDAVNMQHISRQVLR